MTESPLSDTTAACGCWFHVCVIHRVYVTAAVYHPQQGQKPNDKHQPERRSERKSIQPQGGALVCSLQIVRTSKEASNWLNFDFVLPFVTRYEQIILLSALEIYTCTALVQQ